MCQPTLAVQGERRRPPPNTAVNCAPIAATAAAVVEAQVGSLTALLPGLGSRIAPQPEWPAPGWDTLWLGQVTQKQS